MTKILDLKEIMLAYHITSLLDKRSLLIKNNIQQYVSCIVFVLFFEEWF